MQPEDFQSLMTDVCLAHVRPFLCLRCTELLCPLLGPHFPVPLACPCSVLLWLLRGSLSTTLSAIFSFVDLYSTHLSLHPVFYLQPHCPSFTIYFFSPSILLAPVNLLSCEAAFHLLAGCCSFCWAPAIATLKGVESAFSETHYP